MLHRSAFAWNRTATPFTEAFQAWQDSRRGDGQAELCDPGTPSIEDITGILASLRQGGHILRDTDGLQAVLRLADATELAGLKRDQDVASDLRKIGL